SRRLLARARPRDRLSRALAAALRRRRRELARTCGRASVDLPELRVGRSAPTGQRPPLGARLAGAADHADHGGAARLLVSLRLRLSDRPAPGSRLVEPRGREAPAPDRRPGGGAPARLRAAQRDEPA